MKSVDTRPFHPDESSDRGSCFKNTDPDVQKVYAPFLHQSGVPLVEHELVVQQEGHFWAYHMRLGWRKLVGFQFLLSVVGLQGFLKFFWLGCAVLLHLEVPFSLHVKP